MKKSLILYTFLGLLAMSCQPGNDSLEEKPVIKGIELTLEEANRLAAMPLHCMQVEYPNKLNQTLESEAYLKGPKELHPAFYGCFDWHSSVHGHWMLVSLLRQFPQLDQADMVKGILLENISKENIEAEVAYFFTPQNAGFERTYGWAWVLKLAEELHLWNDPLARELEVNLEPLTQLMVEKYLEFLPKLIYPVRVGEHSNIAFGLSFAYDYAETVGHEGLRDMIRERAIFWFENDENCPLNWEPSGYDFLSPCLQELDIMRKVMEREDFDKWLKRFLPALSDKAFDLKPGRVNDRSDGKLVHLDGVNFSRAWVLYGLIKDFPEEYGHLLPIANAHIEYSLPSIVDDNYEGTHWLGSFAVFALQQVP